jgi:hypothetical protein
MKFCCERFQNYHERPRTRGPNIRIIKYDPLDLVDNRYLYRYYISYDYEQTQKLVPNMNIAYCPFCGTSLFQFYNSDNYVNEQPGLF